MDKTEAPALIFDSVSADEIQRSASTRSTKYAPLVDACLKLSPGKAIKVPVPQGADPDKTRTNISNAVRVKAAAHFAALKLPYKIRVVSATHPETGPYIGIVCSEIKPDEKKPGRKPALAPTKKK